MPIRRRFAVSAFASGVSSRLIRLTSSRRTRGDEIDMGTRSYRSVTVLAGPAGIELRDHLLPAGRDQRLVSEVGGGGKALAAVEPDVRFSAVHPHQQRAAAGRRLAHAQVG